MPLILVLAFLVFSFGCETSSSRMENLSDLGASLGDAESLRTTEDAAMEASPDSSQAGRDLGLSDMGIPDVGAELSSDVGDTGSFDASGDDSGLLNQDMGTTSETPNRENRGQCISDDDCRETGILGRSCSRSLPGGACEGCGVDDDCPSGAACPPIGGVCATECRFDDDCPAGRYCTSRALCAVIRCQQGRCPDPRFGCSELDLCARRSCSMDSECTQGTICEMGYCVVSGWR